MKIGPNPTRGCVDEFSFHALLLFEIEFRQHLPAVLQIHVLAWTLCIRRTTGRCYRNSVSDQSRAWKLTPSTHPRAVQKTWTIQNRYGYRYAKICIFPTVSLSNGRRLARLRDIQTSYISHHMEEGCRMPHLGVGQSDESRTVENDLCNGLSCNKGT